MSQVTIEVKFQIGEIVVHKVIFGKLQVVHIFYDGTSRIEYGCRDGNGNMKPYAESELMTEAEGSEYKKKDRSITI
jgi:hypothetical protein